jgi:hypothetical protein
MVGLLICWFVVGLISGGGGVVVLSIFGGVLSATLQESLHPWG